MLYYAGKKLSSGSSRIVLQSIKQNLFNIKFDLYFWIIRQPVLCWYPYNADIPPSSKAVASTFQQNANITTTNDKKLRLKIYISTT